jgi:hypothetical protein
MRDAEAILGEAARSMAAVAQVAGAVETAAAACARAIRGGGQVFFCGNGGSSADAQHLAGEFLGRFLKERPAWASRFPPTSPRSPPSPTITPTRTYSPGSCRASAATAT